MTMGYSIDADIREMVGIFFDGQMRDSGKKELCLKNFCPTRKVTVIISYLCRVRNQNA